MQGLADWRLKPERWVEIALDVNNAGPNCESLGKVSEIRRVSIEDARALGFWHDDLTDETQFQMLTVWLKCPCGAMR